jgi:hypothetical protein
MSRLRPARLAACVLACVLVPTLAFAAPLPAKPKPAVRRAVEGVNLLANPGFEEALRGHAWMPASWDTSIVPLPTVFFGRDTFQVHGGRWAVNVANLSTQYPMWHNWNQSVVVGPETWGKDLVFSVWTRSNGLQGRAYVMIQAYRDTIGRMAKAWGMERDAAGKRLGLNKVDDPLIDFGWKREYFSDPETEWVRRELRVFVAPLTNMIYLRLGLFGTGEVVFDDASLVLAPALPPAPVAEHENLFTDPSFEGDGNAWEYAMPAYEGMQVVRDTTVAHTGRAAIRSEGGLTGMVQTRAGVCQVFSNRSLAGRRLKLSGFIRTDSLQGNAYLKIYCHTPRGMFQSNASPSFGMNNDWSESTVEMDAPPDTYEVWAWLLYNAPVYGRVWFDDARFEVLGPAKGDPVGMGIPPEGVSLEAAGAKPTKGAKPRTR